MQPRSFNSNVLWLVLATAAFVIVCRLWLAIDLPLTDTTEARYGEMARKMVETGNWLMPQHDYGVPYLAKPPLAIWLSAAGIGLLGAGELGPRLLILIASIGFLVYLHQWLKREIGPGSAATGVLTLMGSTLFFVAMAAVMTDFVLVACVDIALLAFWQRIQHDSRPAHWALFVAIGLGLLTKGPLAAFLVLVPIVLWAWFCNRLRDTWYKIAWIRGSVVTALIALPWYLIAEWRYPGFLQYFLIGENLQRFLVSDWQGDLYGAVHEAQHGVIWLYLLIATVPWSLISIVVFFRVRHNIRENWHKRRELVAFALAAAIVPMALFTAATNIIFPYALPAVVPCLIAALALLGEDLMTSRLITGIAMTTGATAFAFALASGVLHGRIEKESEHELVAAATSQFNVPLDELHYWRHRYFSADYYSQGHSDVVNDSDEIDSIVRQPAPFLLAMKDSEFAALPDETKSALQWLGSYSKKSVYGPASHHPMPTHSVAQK